MAKVIDHFDRLVRVMQAHLGGLEVKSMGPITEASGAGQLAAFAPAAGSFALPLRLEPPKGEMFPLDYKELDEVVKLLAEDGESLEAKLQVLPDRVGNELVGLLKAARTGAVDLGIFALREKQLSAQVELSATTAAKRVETLEKPVSSAVGHQILQGYLWRIDIKHNKATIDTAEVGEESSTPAIVAFDDEQLEELRPLLRDYVELEVAVTEERRRYEQAARSREMRLLHVESWTSASEN